jgi:TPR repeat protein
VEAACLFKENCGIELNVDDLNAKDICFLSVHVEKENVNVNTNKPGKTAAKHYSEDAKAIAAIYNLGLMYAHGTVVEVDKAKAAELYAKAHAAGHVKATYNLGLMYQRGEGVEQDSAKAVELYEQAHARGYSKATYNLGKMFDRGIGVEQDRAKAAALFSLLTEEKTDIGSLRTRLKKTPCKPILHLNVL